MLLPPAAAASEGIDLDGHAGYSCGHVHTGADCVHSPAGKAYVWFIRAELGDLSIAMHNQSSATPRSSHQECYLSRRFPDRHCILLFTKIFAFRNLPRCNYIELKESTSPPAGDDLDWNALLPEEVLCLAEKPMRVFLAGEGGTGKTHAVKGILVNAAYRFFLGRFCEAQALAFTNRAAGLYGDGAQTMMGYLGMRPEGANKGGRSGCRTGGGPPPGGGGAQSARVARTERMRGVHAYVIDEVSQLDSALFDDHNKGVYTAREARDRIAICDSLAGHQVHPYAMTRLVVQSGDWAQPGLSQFFLEKSYARNN